MKAEHIKKHLIKSGVSNLKEFGYPDANEENILTDLIYKAFFVEMLEENLGVREDIDAVINELLKELNSDGN